MTAYRLLPDMLLIARLKKGDEDAFAEIYTRYAGKLTGFASSKLSNLDDARDIIHDVFVKLWENKSEISVPNNLKLYLFTIIRRRVVDKIRKNITREEYASMMQSLANPDYDMENRLEAKELQQQIDRSLDQVTPRIKEIYKLSRNDGLSNHEIADKLDLSEQTVKNQLSTALKHLRKSLTGLTIPFIICWWLWYMLQV